MRSPILALLLMGAFAAQAQVDLQPVVVEGVVPDQATKAQILDPLRELYGSDRVVDRIQVESIPTPPNWGSYVAGMITPGLQRQSRGFCDKLQFIVLTHEMQNSKCKMQN